jgi:hypothetical protein
VSVELADTPTVAESISGKQSWLINQQGLDEKTALTVGPNRKHHER